MIVAAGLDDRKSLQALLTSPFVALIGEALPLTNILLQLSRRRDGYHRRIATFAQLQQRHRAPFQVVVRLILAQDGEAQALMKTQRAGIEPEYAAANRQPGLGGFLLDTLDQHGSDSLPLEIRVDGDINQLQFSVTGRYP